jgi:hypothetical protein
MIHFRPMIDHEQKNCLSPYVHAVNPFCGHSTNILISNFSFKLPQIKFEMINMELMKLKIFRD